MLLILAQINEGLSAAGDFAERNGITSLLLVLLLGALLIGLWKAGRWLATIIQTFAEKIWSKVEAVLNDVSAHSKVNSESLGRVGSGIETIALESAAIKKTHEEIKDQNEKMAGALKRGLTLCMDWAPNDERRIPQKLKEIYDEL